jgi:hypothetical protein
MAPERPSRAALSRLLAAGALPLLALATVAAAAAVHDAATLQAQASPREQDSNPFVDNAIKPPPFVPLPVKLPWNLYEIPELPKRFVAYFRWNNQLNGRWIYDFVVRKSLVEYFLTDVARSGFLMNYQVLAERMLVYDTAGAPAGEKCTNFDLVKPYDNMWSPTTMRFTQVYQVEHSDESFLEDERTRATVQTSGVSDDYIVTMHQFTNGTLREISIGRSRWVITRFEDLSRLDNYDSDRSEPLLAVQRPPTQACVYGGGLTVEHAAIIQPRIPYLLVKPFGNKPSLTREEKNLA